MALYKVLRPNPFYKVGAFVEAGADGFVQQVYMSNETEKYTGPAGHIGMMFPLHEVRPYLLEIRRNGLDKYEGGALQ